MKKIRFRQVASVLETAEYVFDRDDFNYLVENYEIENVTYEDICNLFEGGEDFLITVVDDVWFPDDNGGYLTIQPRMVSAYSFFNNFMENEAWDGVIERELTDIADPCYKIQ